MRSAARQHALDTAKKLADTKQARVKKIVEPKTPRVLPTVTVTLTGVADAFRAKGYTPSADYADGPHEFAGWTANFSYCSQLVRELRASGIRLNGNYKTAEYTAVVDGKIVVVKGQPPVGKPKTGTRKPKTAIAPSSAQIAGLLASDETAQVEELLAAAAAA